MAVVKAVSTLTGENPVEMNQLHTVVDPDALDTVFAPTQRPYERLDGSVRFEYHGYFVVVNANGRGYIYESREECRQSAEGGIATVKSSPE